MVPNTSPSVGDGLPTNAKETAKNCREVQDEPRVFSVPAS